MNKEETIKVLEVIFGCDDMHYHQEMVAALAGKFPENQLIARVDAAIKDDWFRSLNRFLGRPMEKWER